MTRSFRIILWSLAVPSRFYAFSEVIRVCPAIPTTFTHETSLSFRKYGPKSRRQTKYYTSLSASSLVPIKIVKTTVPAIKNRFHSYRLFREINLPSRSDLMHPERIKEVMFALFQYLGKQVSEAFQQSRRIRTLTMLSLLCTFIYFALDSKRTKERQSIDATSEWARYSDHPSVRGRALFSLLIRIGFILLSAKLINSVIPGGELFPMRKIKNDKIFAEQKTLVKSEDLPSHKWAALKAEKLRRHAGSTFAEGLLRIGPLYIKIGQILSCRKNLFPDEWKEPMERLQDRVPAKSGKEALRLAYSAYDGGETEFNSIFSSIDDVPLAAASLGQVHKATLKSNNMTVAIKLQRPRLKQIYDKDLALMRKIAKGVDKLGTVGDVGGVKQSWEKIFGDAEEILYREINYRKEAENAIRFASDFGLGKNGTATQCRAKSLDGKVLKSAASWLRTPYIYDQISNERALVMEYLPSIKISDNDGLDKEGVTQEEKERLAEMLARSYLWQFCCGKFFSTDPHSGNLGVIVEKGRSGKGKSVKLVFYDFGQACSLQDDQATGILHVIEGIISYDVEKCVDAFQTMGVLSDNVDLDKVRRKVKDNFETGKLKVKKRRNRKKDSSQASVDQQSPIITDIPTDVKLPPVATNSSEGEINDAEIMSYFTLPAEYAFVARALSQMDGVGKNLDVEFDFISGAAPYIVEIKGSEKYLTDEFVKYSSNVQKSALQWQKQLFRGLGFEQKQSKE